MMTRKYLPILILFVFCYWNCAGQSFEGKITYRISEKTPDPKRTSQETIDWMFQDTDSIVILYISKNRYKLVTLAGDTGLPRTINHYDPATNMVYDYQPESKFVMKSANPPAITYRKKIVKKGGQETLLDKDCAVVSLSFLGTQALIYYSRNFSVDVKDIRIDAPLFLQFMRQTEAIPLKIILSGNGAVHALEFEATSVVAEKLADDVFDIPEQD